MAYSADNRASDALRRLLEVLPRGLRRLWDGAPCPVTLAQFPARQYLAGKIRFRHLALYYNYPPFTALIDLLGARLFKIPETTQEQNPHELICICERRGGLSVRRVGLWLTAEAAGFFVAPGAPGPFPAAFPAGNALADASSASIISCNAERGDCIVEGCRPRRARRDGEGC